MNFKFKNVLTGIFVLGCLSTTTLACASILEEQPVIQPLEVMLVGGQHTKSIEITSPNVSSISDPSRYPGNATPLNNLVVQSNSSANVSFVLTAKGLLNSKIVGNYNLNFDVKFLDENGKVLSTIPVDILKNSGQTSGLIYKDGVLQNSFDATYTGSNQSSCQLSDVPSSGTSNGMLIVLSCTAP